MLHELESLALESRLLKNLGNITFGNFSININFGTWIVNFTTISGHRFKYFTTLSESMFSRKGLLTNSVVRDILKYLQYFKF